MDRHKQQGRRHATPRHAMPRPVWDRLFSNVPIAQKPYVMSVPIAPSVPLLLLAPAHLKAQPHCT